MADTDTMIPKPWGGLSPFESWMMAEKTSKRPSGTAIAGITVASVAAAAAIGAWIFGGTFAAARSNTATKLADANHQNTLALINQGQVNTNATIDRLINALYAERNERVAQGVTLTQTVSDTVSGEQASNLTAQQQSDLSAMQNLQNTLLTDAVTGRSSLNPTPVSLYSSPSPCGCPGCNS